MLTKSQEQSKGELRLRDQTRPIVITAILEEQGTRLVATGNVLLRQSDFGIKPVSAGAGTVRVKDEMVLTFRVVGGAP